jgi:hypothetical protein
MSRQSPGDSPITDSSNSATIAAAIIATGKASPASPSHSIGRNTAQPTAPPAPAGNGSVGCNTEQATAPSSKATSSSPRRRASRWIGRCSISRNAQPSSAAGTR